VDTVVTPRTDDVRRTFNLVKRRDFTSPIVIKVWMLSRTIQRVFNKIIAPVPEDGITKLAQVRFDEFRLSNQSTYHSENCFSGMPPLNAISRYISVIPSTGMMALEGFCQQSIAIASNDRERETHC
jgi:hypothetical protein